MEHRRKLADLMNAVLASQADLADKVKDLQRYIWDHIDSDDSAVAETLRDLACDLDYFEPDPSQRRAEPSFIDEQQARRLVEEALRELEGPNPGPTV